MTTALILGGGAPNLTLMSGTLAAFAEEKARFDVIGASGAGMLVGLLYATNPPGKRAEALASTKDMGVSDEIYDLYSVNYKVFEKPGILADAYRKVLAPYLDSLPQNTPFEMLTHDWARLIAATFSPTNLFWTSKGLSAAAPWIEKAVDFQKLKELKNKHREFYINAYNVDKEEIDTFFTEDITADHFRAALAFPFLYPSFPLRGRDSEWYNHDRNVYNYIEGSAVDSFNFDSLFDKIKIHERHKIKNVIVVDVLSNRKIIREPKSLYHAWVQSIMVPLVFMAEDDWKLFNRCHKNKYPDVRFEPVCIEIPHNRWPTILDWSRSNLSILYDIGFEAGRKFYRKNKEMFLVEDEP